MVCYILFGKKEGEKKPNRVRSDVCGKMSPWLWGPSLLPLAPSLVAQMVKNLPAMWETWVWSLDGEDPLEKGMASHSSNSCLERSMDRGAWQGQNPWGHKESDPTGKLTHTHTTPTWPLALWPWGLPRLLDVLCVHWDIVCLTCPLGAPPEDTRCPGWHPTHM